MSKTERKLVGMIVEGRNLAPKDPNGLSDPFLTFGPIDKKGNWAFSDKRSKPFKSKTTRKTLNPVWRMPFEIPVESNCKGFKVEVWDWDMIGTDFMGQCVIQVSDLPKGRESENWYKLVARNSKKDVVSGEVLIRILYSQETEKMNLGGTMVSSVSKRMTESGSPTITTTSALPNIGEEEYSAMDDMRSGEIDLIMPALFKYAASLPCLQIGLPCLSKWAMTSSVAERIEFLNKYQSSLFEFLVQCATEFKLDAVVVFYALSSFGPFLRLIEAKQYFTSTIASLLANSLQEPPATLSSEDRARHCANCLIALANACTDNVKELKNVENSKERIDRALETTSKCEEIVVSSGALRVALSLLNSNSTVSKHILALIIKTCQKPTVKKLLLDVGFASTTASILHSSSDPVAIWLSLDALAKYASPVDKDDPKTVQEHIRDVSASPTLLASFLRILSLESTGIHGASIQTGIVYLIYALSRNFKDGTWQTKNFDPSLITLLQDKALATYLEFIPKREQRALIFERSLQVLRKMAKGTPELQKQLGSTFSVTANFVVQFAQFPGATQASSSYIRQMVKWNVLSADSAREQLQTVLTSAEFDESTHSAMSDLLEKL